MEHDLSQLLERLIAGEVEFVVIGGFAALVHGCTLVTHDVDVAIALREPNLVKLWQALEGTNPRFRNTRPPRHFTLDEARRSDWKKVSLETDLGVIDCLGEVKAVGGYEACLKRSIAFDFDGAKARVLDREALIEAKLAVGRPRDIQAVNQLRVLEGMEDERE